MAVLKSLLPLQLRSIARAWGAGGNATATWVVTCALAVFLCVRAATRAPHAAAAAATQPLPALLLLLALVTGAAVVLALVGCTPRRAAGLTPMRLRTQPVSHATFVALTAVALAVHPAVVLGAAAQALAVRPLWTAHAPAAAAIAAILYAIAATAIAAFVVHASTLARRRFWLAAAVAAIAVLRWAPSERDAAVAAALHGATQHVTATCLALGAVAIAAAAATVALHVVLLRRLGDATPPAPRARRHVRAIGRAPGLPLPLAVAVAREARVVAGTADLRAGLLFSALGIVLTVLLPEVEPAFALVWVNLALLAHVAYAFNAYGLDAAGVDRLRLLPLASRDLVSAKNVTLSGAVALQVLPFAIATAWRLGLAVALWVVMLSALATLLFAAIGNATSFAWAAPRDARAWTGNDSPGDIVPAMLGFGVAAVNAMLGFIGLAMGARGIALGAIALAIALVLWTRSRARATRRLDRAFDVLRARLVT